MYPYNFFWQPLIVLHFLFIKNQEKNCNCESSIIIKIDLDIYYIYVHYLTFAKVFTHRDTYTYKSIHNFQKVLLLKYSEVHSKKRFTFKD